MAQLRENKKKETRQRISDVATALFFERGYDAVTVDEIAVAAQVSKMTIFNYFARKEELILDREDDLKLLPFRRALRSRPAGQAPLAALRALVQEMHQQKHAMCHVSSQAVDWWVLVEASPALKARLRELADEAAEELAIELGGANPDASTRLMAGMIVLTVRLAREEAIRLVKRKDSANKASAAFLALMEEGFSAAERLQQR
ncbi:MULTISPECIES: TetR/AcrR family transcriptional regulator [unclassified Janthinobacterium]|uniref:TetR/AcrR family transcriptional regulator n=1 Tax=unclassified Janthinobacterium TaxID=2610881 RepID=UPI00161B4705|nr:MULTISPECIES: TetR/AcrR family transcriptional regulator [unclassified Janthinobacterium]MBB5609334.1 AcrR family transcriptional regulator [Janthinobacterium sp. S3T4]MBB5614507.1 AcrR family transcriptional regulator [Janthinobacterium sp. S3M3]